MNGPLGDPSVKTITSTNVENAFPLNLCLSDASTLGTIYLRRRQIFTIFDPYPPPSADFYYHPSANLTNI